MFVESGVSFDAEVDVDPYDLLPKWLISRRSVRGRAQLCRVLP